MKRVAVTLHGFPADLDKLVEAYAKEGGRLKGRAYEEIVRAGLGVVRGEIPGPGVRRGE